MKLGSLKEGGTMYTIFFDTDEMPQDFDTYAEAKEYGDERVMMGLAPSYVIERAG